jgi:hypothetical protein
MSAIFVHPQSTGSQYAGWSDADLLVAARQFPRDVALRVELWDRASADIEYRRNYELSDVLTRRNIGRAV